MATRPGSARRRMAVLLASAAILTPLFARTVKTEVGYGNPDFAGYKTYQFLGVKLLGKTGIVDNDPVVAPAAKQAVTDQLTARGLTEVPEGGDLQVSILVFTDYFPQMEAAIFANGIPYLYGTPIATMGRYNKQGTLAVNLIDSHTKKFAWAGYCTESLDNKQGSGVKKIPKAAANIFKKYPKTK